MVKEEEFMKRFSKPIKVKIYYSLDDYGNVILDTDGMLGEFNIQLNDIWEQTIVEEDELQKTMEEKLEQIKKKNETKGKR